MVKNLWKVDEVNAKRKGDGSSSQPTKVGMNENDVGDVGQYSKGETDFASMFDLLWGHFTTDQADECVSDRVHSITASLGISLPRGLNHFTYITFDKDLLNFPMPHVCLEV